MTDVHCIIRTALFAAYAVSLYFKLMQIVLFIMLGSLCRARIKVWANETRLKLSSQLALCAGYLINVHTIYM